MAKITTNPADGTLTLEMNGVEQVYKPLAGIDATELYATLEQMGQYFPTNVIAYLRANAKLQDATLNPAAAALDPAATPPEGSDPAAATYTPPEGEEPPPGTPVESTRVLEASAEAARAKYPLAGPTVDGRTVGDEVANTGSIGSSLDDAEQLDGIREVPFSAFDQMGELSFHSASEKRRTEELAAAIEQSNQIDPLIVVEDGEGPYVLEGGHRFDALRLLGAKSFPALVVLDLDTLDEAVGVSDQGIAAPSDGSATIDGVALAPDMPQDGDWPGMVQGDERPVYTGDEASYLEDYAEWQKSFPDGVVYTKVDGGNETALVDSKVVGVWDPALNSGTVFDLAEVTSQALGFTPATASDPAVPGETEEQWQRDMAAKTYPHTKPSAKPKQSEGSTMKFVVREKASRKQVAGPFATLDEAQAAHIFEHGFSDLLEAADEADTTKQDWESEVDPDAATVAKTKVGDTDVYTATDDAGKPISTYVDDGDGKGREIGKTESGEWENLRSVAGGGGRKPIKNAWKTVKVNDRVMFKTDTQTRTGIVTYKDEQPDGAITVDVGGQSLEVPSMDITAVWRKSAKESAPVRFMLTKQLVESKQTLNEGAPKRARNLVQYSDGGNQLATSRVTRPTLEAGMYEIKESMSGLYFEKVDINSDELLKFEDARLNGIHEEINSFWGLSEVFEEMGITHKRGVLLFGSPGQGKSCLLKQCIEAAIEQDTVVFVGARSMSRVVAGLREFKEVEPDRRALVVMEDMDEICNYDEHAVLEMMDGGDQMNGVLVLGTTNYPERLPPRIMRSGRFDTKMEVKALPIEGRIAYFNHKLAKKESEARIKEIAEATDGMSFAQMRELIASVYCYGRPMEASIQRIMKNLTEGKTTGHNWTEKQLDRLLAQGVTEVKSRMLTEGVEPTEKDGVTSICGKEQWKAQVLAVAADATFEEDKGTIWAWQDGRCVGSYVTELNSGILEAEEQPDPTLGTGADAAGADLGTAIDLKSATDEQLQTAFFGKTVAQILSGLSGEYAVDDILGLATRSDFETLEPATRAIIMTAFDFFSTQTEAVRTTLESEPGVALGELPDNDSGVTGDHAELRRTQDAGKNGDWKVTIYRGWTKAEEWEYFGDKAAALAWAADKGISWSKSDLQRLGEGKVTRAQLDEMWDKYDRLDRACNEEFGEQAPAARRAQVTKSFNEFSKACQYMGLNPAKEVRERTKASATPDTVVTEGGDMTPELQQLVFGAGAEVGAPYEHPSGNVSITGRFQFSTEAEVKQYVRAQQAEWKKAGFVAGKLDGIRSYVSAEHGSILWDTGSWGFSDKGNGPKVFMGSITLWPDATQSTGKTAPSGPDDAASPYWKGKERKIGEADIEVAERRMLESGGRPRPNVRPSPLLSKLLGR